MISAPQIPFYGLIWVAKCYMNHSVNNDGLDSENDEGVTVFPGGQMLPGGQDRRFDHDDREVGHVPLCYALEVLLNCSD